MNSSGGLEGHFATAHELDSLNNANPDMCAAQSAPVAAPSRQPTEALRVPVRKHRHSSHTKEKHDHADKVDVSEKKAAGGALPPASTGPLTLGSVLWTQSTPARGGRPLTQGAQTARGANRRTPHPKPMDSAQINPAQTVPAKPQTPATPARRRVAAAAAAPAAPHGNGSTCNPSAAGSANVASAAIGASSGLSASSGAPKLLGTGRIHPFSSSVSTAAAAAAAKTSRERSGSDSATSEGHCENGFIGFPSLPASTAPPSSSSSFSGVDFSFVDRYQRLLTDL